MSATLRSLRIEHLWHFLCARNSLDMIFLMFFPKFNGLLIHEIGYGEWMKRKIVNVNTLINFCEMLPIVCEAKVLTMLCESDILQFRRKDESAWNWLKIKWVNLESFFSSFRFWFVFIFTLKWKSSSFEGCQIELKFRFRCVIAVCMATSDIPCDLCSVCDSNSSICSPDFSTYFESVCRFIWITLFPSLFHSVECIYFIGFLRQTFQTKAVIKNNNSYLNLWWR